MSPLVRRIVAVIAAFVSASAIVMLLEWCAARWFPIAGVDPAQREQLEAAMRDGRVPFGAMALVATGWIVAALVGATVALKVGREGGRGATVIFAVLFTLACVANLLMLPHPIWMWVVGVAVVPGVAMVAGRDRSAA